MMQGIVQKILENPEDRLDTVDTVAYDEGVEGQTLSTPTPAKGEGGSEDERKTATPERDRKTSRVGGSHPKGCA